MWFKNLRLYRLTAPFQLSVEDLHERLAEQPFRPCGKMEFATYGWVPPLGRHGATLCHAANGCLLISARREEKIVPTSLINELLADKVAEIEEQQMRRVPRREREALRDDIVDRLLPQALIRSRVTYAYLSPRDGWLVIDSPSLNKAEALTQLLRRSLGSLPLVLAVVKESPASVLTRWLKETAPSDILLGEECELHDAAEEGGVVRCRRQDLAADEVQAHLEAGKQAVRLAITWRERIACVIGDDLSVKRLRFLDVVREQSDDRESTDEIARFDADVALMTLELGDFLPRLMEFFGGEDEAAYRRVLRRPSEAP